MNSSSYILVRYRETLFIIAIALLCLTGPALCQTNSVAIMIQQSPPEGGTVTPGIGVHSLAANSELPLTAVPKPGYQFVCWMGDVTDTTAGRTSAYIDSPKIIIAVFERTQFDFLAGQEKSKSAPGQRLYPSAADYTSSGISPVARKRPHKYNGYTPQEPEPPEDDDEDPFLVPEDGDEFLIPEVPEPATAALLAIGSLLLAGKRKLKRP